MASALARRDFARSPLPVTRLDLHFTADEHRVITRPFFPGGERRVRNIISRVDGMSNRVVQRALAQVREDFDHRHVDLDGVFEEHCRQAFALVEGEREDGFDRAHRLLIGAYFTMEYAFASTALFNPSIVPHPDQSGIPDGAVRFILSLRATGEGHISSIVFRTGVIEADLSVRMDPAGRFYAAARTSPDRLYDNRLFARKLAEMGIDREAIAPVMERLPEHFTMEQLDDAIDHLGEEDGLVPGEETTEGMRWLARANYLLEIPEDGDISEVVIFPQSEDESRGIEDLRMVPFVEDDGTTTYFGTYTAYNGYRVLPQLLETDDFHRIRIHTLNGASVQNKGLALFPRRIDGHYVMCSRIDGENLYIMCSDMVYFWETAELLQAPKHPWEAVQVGNGGSPLETPEGWLLLTHGVGPMRAYCIGAMLLDLDDPLRVIGHLDEPLLMPNEREREGYVPNVVYTCGALIHAGQLYIPYAMSDTASGFAVVPLNALLDRLAG